MTDEGKKNFFDCTTAGNKAKCSAKFCLLV